ncbi:MAG: DUF1232 domain-containing protein [Candidatus Binatia bacterium]|nr:DUF1232 domain-containing protein [Candidatus Binatia bacterium]
MVGLDGEKRIAALGEPGSIRSQRFSLPLLLCVVLALGGGLINPTRADGEGPLPIGVGGKAVVTVEVGEGEVSPRLKQFRKDLRQALRRFRKVVGYSLRVWVAWLPAMVFGFGWVLLVGAWDRSVWGRLKENGVRAAWRSFGRGLAVYVRLLRHPASPTLGKVLVAAALLYAGAPRDLLWDTRSVAGFFDDGVVLALAARSFLKMCPEALVESQAKAVVAGGSARHRSKKVPWVAQARENKSA